MAFSGGVKLGDLDDFISASQDCVKPLIEAASGRAAKLDGSADGLRGAPSVVPSAPAVGRAAAARSAAAEASKVQRPNLIKTKTSAADPKAQIGQVTLSDCLACSGCVTSAETVLLQEQSGKEFLRRVGEAPLTVVSISFEARTSLAVHCRTSPLLALQRVAGALRRLGVAYVLECSAAEAMALLEGKAEFMQRFRASAPSAAPSASAAAGGPAGGGATALPLLTSHCPGWTCYAEKVVDPKVLPHLAPLRPPQQVQGRLVKTCLLEAHNRRRLHRWWRVRSPLFAAECGWWLRSLRRSSTGCGRCCGRCAEAEAEHQAECRPLGPRDVYHVSVQPCYDRKIEAARPQFETVDAEGVREVDTVLATTELLEILLRRAFAGGAGTEAPEAPPPPPEAPAEGWTETAEAVAEAELFAALPAADFDNEVLTDLLLGDLRAGRPGGAPLLSAVQAHGGSGGFLEHVFRHAARDLFDIEVATPLEFSTKQNEDMREVLLRDTTTGKVLLRFVSACGFRNIQNVIRRLTKDGDNGRSLECGHFVEVLACPGGCLNGAGQAPAPGPKAERRAHLRGLEAALHEGEGTAYVAPEAHPLVLPLYRYVASLAGPRTPEAPEAPAREAPAQAAPEAGAGPGAGGEVAQEPLERLVGGPQARAFLGAGWWSLRVDSEGRAVVGSSALKW